MLDITGTGSIANGLVFDYSTAAADTMILKLDLSGGVKSALNIKMNSGGQTLEVGRSTALTILAAETVSKGTLRMSGGSVVDTAGITVGGQGGLGLIVGAGTLAISLTGGDAKGTTDTITAFGGTLDITGAFAAGAATFVATIDSASASTVKLDGNAVVGQPIVINSASQTLEIGTAGTLTVTGLEVITNGTIRMDSGTLADAAGLAVDTAATLTGSGLITAGTRLLGDGTVKASGGTLELGSDVTSVTTAFDIDTVTGSVMKVDGAVAAGATLTFLGAAGTLELADVVGGVLQGFNGAIAGVNVNASTAVPSNEINIQASATSAVLSGSTITVFNGTTTVATLALSGVPVHGAHALVKTDAVLGGQDVFLTNQPPAAPATPVLAAASDSGVEGDNITRIATPVIIGTGVAGDIITLLDGVTSVGSTTVDVNGDWSIAVATLAEGRNVLTATQSDVFGNASTPSAALNIILDTTAPPVTVILGSDTGVSASDHITSSAVLTGSGDANTTVTISNGVSGICTAAVGAGGIWSFKPAGLADGSYSLTVSETDVAGNIGSATLALILDTASPAAPSTPDLLAASDSGASSTDNVTNGAAPTFTGTAEANATITLFDSATVVGSALASASGAWTATTAALAGGIHVITARATDLAGNLGVSSGALAVTIDTAAPVAPSTPDLSAVSDSGMSNSDNVTNVTTPTFTGVAEANATIRLLDGTSTVGTGQADAAGAWSVTTSALAPGDHAVTANATDLAGNGQRGLSCAGGHHRHHGSACPSTPDLFAVSDSDTSSIDNVTNVTNISKPTFTGVAEPNAAITLFDGTTVVGTGQADAAGAWSMTTATLVSGVRAITAKATDLAGIVGVASAALAVSIDTTLPTPPSIATVTTSIIAGFAEANSTVEVVDGAVRVATSSTNADGA